MSKMNGTRWERVAALLQRVVDERLTNESRWIKDAGAVDAAGVVVPPDSTRAVAWGLLGAVRSLDVEARWLPVEAGRMLQKAIFPYRGTLMAYNDEPVRTFSEIRATIERAQALASRRATFKQARTSATDQVAA